MQSFHHEEVFVPAIPVIALVLIAQMYLAGTYRRSALSENGRQHPQGASGLIPSIPKVNLGGKEGRVVRWGYLLTLTFGPVAMLIQCLYEMVFKAKLYDVRGEGSPVGSDFADSLSFPFSAFSDAIGSGVAFRWRDPFDGKEAYPPVQMWLYLILSAAVALMLVWYFVVLLRSARQGKRGVPLAAAIVAFATAAPDSTAEEKRGLEVLVPRTAIEELLRAGVPERFDLPPQPLGGTPFWRDVRVEEPTVEIPRGTVSLRFTGPDIAELGARADVSSKLRYEYEHVWTEDQWIQVGPLKTKVPKVRSETRTRDADVSPAVTARARFRVSLEDGGMGKFSSSWNRSILRKPASAKSRYGEPMTRSRSPSRKSAVTSPK